ncbi:MAG: T9SS type A sorting domain-containing protein [Bacteroidales bacterium]|nr:T9SS type A sorting domain-containing protein [Bacteroidales bacterium]MDY0217307.1 T9SS type A sorting domain-containing protein [Bacteroidales bacterium]
MKKTTLLFLSVVFVLFANLAFGQTQPPNGNFETWINPNKAEHWNSSVDFITDIHFMNQSATSHDGTNAAKIITQDFSGLSVPGIATYGVINVDFANFTAQIDGGRAFTEKPVKFTGWYQYSPQGGDSLIVLSFLTKFNSVAATRDTVAVAAFVTTQTVSSYTQFVEEFQYLSPDLTPDTMNILILSSGLAATGGTFALIDDLKFDYTPVSVKNNDKIDYYLYPNPSNGVFNISLAIKELTTFTVYSQMGQKVMETSTSELYNVLDLSNLSKGIYLLEINNGKTKQVEKLMVQ